MPTLTNAINFATYGIISGLDNSSEGSIGGWIVARHSSDNTTFEDITGNIDEYFDGDHANFDATAVQIGIPIGAAGYSRFFVSIRNRLGVDADITAYALVRQPGIFQSVSYYGIKYGFRLVNSETLSTGGILRITPNGSVATHDLPAVTNFVYPPFPTNWLAISVNPASDPGATTWWELHVARQ